MGEVVISSRERSEWEECLPKSNLRFFRNPHLRTKFLLEGTSQNSIGVGGRDCTVRTASDIPVNVVKMGVGAYDETMTWCLLPTIMWGLL